MPVEQATVREMMVLGLSAHKQMTPEVKAVRLVGQELDLACL